MTAHPDARSESSTVLRQEVEDLLYEEAALLDDWRLDDWLALLTDDARYIVPTTDLAEGDPTHDLVFIDDDMMRLRGRVTRLKSRHAHREYPSSRTRRLVSNVRILSADGDELTITANFAVYRFRAGTTGAYVGRYVYRLRRVDGALRIVQRRAELDNESLHDHGAVSIIL
jgi:p-cumate 2,3-dioxygenase beta subunit